MDKKMTSGEIAKKAGVSQKAVRLYDEKGLLKPTEYSEGNYRLYDKGALEVLEKIVALKAIGFSLEEIRDNLIAGDAVNVEEALQMQLKNMEQKRYQIDKVCAAIRRTLERRDKELDWDDVAAMVQSISLDQKADERHWDALKHTAKEQDWYEKIFESLPIRKGEKILDLGCGYAKLWRNNWDRIPENTKISGYDLRGSWADDFETYLNEKKEDLPDGVTIDLEFADLEKEATWEQINAKKPYSLIIAHYLQYMLQDPEQMMKRASEVLSEDGVFSVNGPAVSMWYLVLQDVLRELQIKADFLQEKIAAQTAAQEAFETMLKKYFGKVEITKLSNRWHYEEAGDLVQKLKEVFPELEKFLCAKSEKLKAYFAEKIEADGEIVIDIDSVFWHCSK